MDAFSQLYETIKTLRSPEGCPWDKKQTHQSLLPFLFEEANEVGDTIVNNDLKHLKEELGDLLLQILLHARIAEEGGHFTLHDVITILNEKLIRRHPHVFGDQSANDADDVKVLWQSIKDEERKHKDFKSILDKVANNFPPLLKSYKLQKEAAGVGFDWTEIEDVFDKLTEEIDELKEAIRLKNSDEIEHELGDILFSIVNVSRFLKVKPDVALFKANMRFTKRFNYIEDKVKENNEDINALSLKELDAYWDEAKKNV